MVSCQKQQREVHQGEPKTRCIHRESDYYLQIVESQCSTCPLKMLVEKKAPCGEKVELAKRAAIMKNAKVNEPDGEYPSCPFRYRKSDGKPYCSLTNLRVDPEICGRCEKETREQEATIGTKMKNYFGAIRRWAANGRPSRSKDEIKKLFEDHCSKCERYDEKKHACKNCGCSVSTKSQPLGNKLAMATEHCPLGRF